MKSLLQMALGSDWEQLPAALKAHHEFAPNLDIGHLDVEFPRSMKPCLWLLHKCGALLAQRGKSIPTRVEKNVACGRQYWHRTLSYADGRTAGFNSFWVASADACLIEFAKPWSVPYFSPLPDRVRKTVVCPLFLPYFSRTGNNFRPRSRRITNSRLTWTSATSTSNFPAG
ncbi:MAG: DUF4166 domain-containing protein [Rhodocyclaceae bacterium]|nr:DUF4166 domain-containing protein [Rhodocyclaceae bacterium]